MTYLRLVLPTQHFMQPITGIVTRNTTYTYIAISNKIDSWKSIIFSKQEESFDNENVIEIDLEVGSYYVITDLRDNSFIEHVFNTYSPNDIIIEILDEQIYPSIMSKYQSV